MKTLILSVFIILTFFQISAQTPESFQYQAVVRDAGGAVVVNQNVSLKASIISGSATGTVEYVETFNLTTNSFGLIAVSIGTGNVESGVFANLQWGNAPHFFKVEIDPAGSTNYVDMGTVQLLSVPYALHAKSADNSFSGNYNDLTNKPDLTNYDSNVSDDFSGNYADLTNKPTLAGDVTGDIETNTVAKIQGKNVSTNIPGNGQVLKWNNTNQAWEPSDDQLGAAGTTDGVVNGANFTGTTTKTLTLIRTNGLGDIIANFTDMVDDADANPTNEIQSLTLVGNDLTISSGNTVTIPQTTYTPGTGIEINGNQISNLSPDQVVSVNSGAGISVTGTYPDFTITNTQPNQTLNLTGSGATTVTGTYPNLTISSTDNNTEYTSGTGLTLTGTTFSHDAHSGDVNGTTNLTVTGIQGRTVTSALPTTGQVLKYNGSQWTPSSDENTIYNQGTGINITGNTISNTSPDQIVNFTNGTGISVTGTYPDFTITNTQPNQSVNLTGSGATTITGTYPNLTISSTDNNTEYTAGTGLNLAGSTFSHDAHSGDVNGTTNLTVTGIQGRQITSNAPANNQILKWNSTNSRWELGEDELGAAGTNDGVVTSIGVSGTTTKTITLSRSQSLPDLTATFTDDGSVYNAGTGINITGSTITNTAPDQTVTLIGGGSTLISGTYPNFTISSTDANTTYSAGTGLSLAGTTFAHDAHSGDVSGTTNLTVTGIRGKTVSSTLPTNGQILKYNGTQWVPSTDDNSVYTAGTGISISSNQIINTQPHQATNLSQGTRTATSVDVNSSTGTSATLQSASTTQAGVMTAADKTKLDGIATGANNYSHPTGFSSQPTTALSGSNVISQISVNTEGHVTGITSRTISASDIGAASSTHNHSATDINSGTLSSDRGVLAGSTSNSFLRYTGTTNTSSAFNSGTTNPSGLQRLNYSGYLYATQLFDNGSRVFSPSNTNIGTGSTQYAAGDHTHTGMGSVTSIATNNGLTGGTITTSGTIGLTGQALAFHNLSSNGLVTRTASGTVMARTLTAGTGISISDGDGINGNPTISASIGTTSGTVASGDHTHTAYGAAGLNGEIQFNKNGVFGTHSELFWDDDNARMGVGLDDPNAKMTVKGESSATQPLFEVKDRNDNPVFVVYEDSVKIFVNDDASKANKGTFAVSGRNTSKTVTNEYLRISPDSVRVYFDDDFTAAGNTRGGFAVGGFSDSKSGGAENYMNIEGGNNAQVVNSKPKVLWYPTKEAFIAGRVLVQSPDSVGTNSWASGFESRSIGNYSQSMGYRARAYGENATAIGYYANAIGVSSFAFGDSSKAIGEGSFAFGSRGIDTITGEPTIMQTEAIGDHSFALGFGSKSQGIGSFALGNEAAAIGNYSMALGLYDTTYAEHSYAFGLKSITRNKYAVAIGTYNEADGQGSFAFGSGNKALLNGSFAFGTSSVSSGSGSVAFGVEDTASADASFALGYRTKASALAATAMGSTSKATGIVSTAMGNATTASGMFSTSMGTVTLASGTASVAMGNSTTASAGSSTAMGYSTTASGQYSTAMGYQTTASGSYSLALGREIQSSGDYSVAIALNDQNGTNVSQSNTLAIMGGSVGIGTEAPNTTLDLVGSFALRQTTKNILLASPLNNYNIGSGTFFRLSKTTAYTITGILGGVDGRMLILTNVGSGTITIGHQNTGSDAENRIISSTGADITISQNHSLTLIYDATTQRWRDISLR